MTAATTAEQTIAADLVHAINSHHDVACEPELAHDEQPWPVLDDTAMYGLAGRFVQSRVEHTEADPAAMLISVLTAFGNLVGDQPHARVGGARHPARIFAAVVGKTAKARKGTSWRDVRTPLRYADREWASDRHVSGLSSGEGLIAAVADKPKSTDDEAQAPVDKRLLVIEEEFIRPLKVAQREGSTLSPIIRGAWDNGNLSVLTKQRVKADGAHISILAHVTLEELRRGLSETDQSNGFGNRFLYVCAKRGDLLPHGGRFDPRDEVAYGRLIRDAADKASRFNMLRRSTEADERWAQIYQAIADDDPGGLLGDITARADAQTLRLSVIYALLDAANRIEVEHLDAAWAMWRYCYDSAAYIFGDAEGDAIADKLLRELRQAGDRGLNLTQQSALFARNVTAKRLASARDLLERRAKAHTVVEEVEGGGRPRTVTRASKVATS